MKTFKISETDLQELERIIVEIPYKYSVNLLNLLSKSLTEIKEEESKEVESE
jgi:hypothetical protein